MNDYFGKLLIASSKLDATPFCRSVIYVFQDNDNATVGVILNRPADNQVQEAWRGMVGSHSSDGLLSIGGPLAGPVFAIHCEQEAGEAVLPNGFFTATKEQNLQFIAKNHAHPYQVFFGLSGWQKGQLAQEIANGNWLAAEPENEIFFSNECDLWTKAIRMIENRFLKNVLNIRHIQPNILDN